MRLLILTALGGTLLSLGAAQAAGCEGLATDTVLGKTQAEATESLKAMGYEIRKAETEDGKIEIYFVKGAEMGEVYVSPETGAITKMSCEGA